LPASDQVKIRVVSLQITGATVFPPGDLIALTGFRSGSELNLSELDAMAAAITEHYRRNGYFVAQAYLPAQEVKDGSVAIAVSEGRYGAVTLRNNAGLSDGLTQGALSGLSSGDLITNAPLDSRLLLLSDIPGVRVNSTLSPGTVPGTSDLMVDVTAGQRVTGSVDADNAGNRYTGPYRLGATVNLNNALGLGDVASLRAVTSGKGLNYARASYQIQLGKAQAGVAYSWLGYELGREFETLQAHGTARIASVYGRYPLIRTRDNNLYAQLSFDAKTFQDRIDSVPSVADKKSRVLTASLYGDHHDNWGGGGFSGYSLALSTGHLDIESAAARAADALAGRTDGNFGKLAFNAFRVQSLGGPFSIYGAVNGQLASRNLDVSEKMVLGGMNAVRAYPEGEAYADQGLVATLEARMDLPGAPVPGQVQLLAFVDAGSATFNEENWSAGPNHRHLAGAGLGVTWSDPGNFLVRASYARRLGGAATSSPDRSGRFWVQLVKYF
jgi:hemolysin activation/secretion protein